MIKRYLMHRSRQVRELRILLCICSAIVCVATALSAQPAENLAYNGDFELASEKSPPPGWTMWGARKYKIPANYIRDTADPHKGEACFRMYHPAHTGGYIVTEPKHAIRPELVSATALSHSDADAHPMVERKEDVVKGLYVEQHGQNLNFVLPPHSVVFITVNRSE